MGIHFERGRVLIDQKRYDLAERELRKELAENPDDPLTHSLLGLCLIKQTRYQEGAQAAQEALRLAPDLPHAHYVMAWSFQARNQTKQAETALKEAIRLDKERPGYLSLLATVLLKDGRLEEALSTTERSLSLDPHHIESLHNRAMVLLRLNRLEEARTTIDQALARNPEDEIPHVGRGWVHLFTGEHPQAMEHFREALRIAPNSRLALEGVGECLKSRYLVYCLLFRLKVWQHRQNLIVLWGVMLGGVILYFLLRGEVQSSLLVVYLVRLLPLPFLAFVALGQFHSSVFDLLLVFNRIDRQALGGKPVLADALVRGTGALAFLAMAGVWFWTGRTAAFLGVLVIWIYTGAIVDIVNRAPGQGRVRASAVATAAGAAGLAGLTLLLLGYAWGWCCLAPFLLGVLLSVVIDKGRRQATAR